ncbi:hypothetical protein HMPREF9019_0568 [Hoylesella timonensis CRIS 5C-B1]|uniref:Uncharacterized protein n=1 Tax=Hoylesella timonensis CRIS 5C-B1 TaxID=679189 RepID=D1VXB7_9BACT|nr:hypothetical protein HMPREF9019_0568 [Hoylesella timonensis CRIS 5C-B1]
MRNDSTFVTVVAVIQVSLFLKSLSPLFTLYDFGLPRYCFDGLKHFEDNPISIKVQYHQTSL